MTASWAAVLPKEWCSTSGMTYLSVDDIFTYLPPLVVNLLRNLEASISHLDRRGGVWLSADACPLMNRSSPVHDLLWVSHPMAPTEIYGNCSAKLYAMSDEGEDCEEGAIRMT